MDERDKRHFWEMFQGLATSTRYELTEGSLKVYWMALKDLPRADFDRGIEAAVNQCDWFPSVPEFRKLAGHKVKKPEPAYLRPIEGELERIETCQFHVKTPGITAPAPVSWCRKCKRLRLAAARGDTQSIGDMLGAFGLLPSLEKEGQK